MTRRERQLWVALGATVAAVWVSLPFAQEWANELRSRELLDATFFWLFVLLVAGLFLMALRARAGLRQLGIGVAVLGVYGLSLLRIVHPEERTHLFEYSVTAGLLYAALRERSSRRPVRSPAMVAFLGTTALGLVDELIQAALPTRVFDWRDVGFNTFAAALAIGATVAVQRVGASRSGDSQVR